tara:strand:- start:49145 stop:50032 length:888 start_codon:yes stop_codon:yes gene_type:complete
MACENCENGCINPNLCACDCQSCATAGACDIPAGAPGAAGPQGPAGVQGPPGLNGTDGTDGVSGCTIVNAYLSDGDNPPDVPVGHLIIETAPSPDPCNQVFDAGNILDTVSGLDITAVPSGVICMWSGSEGNIPVGWSLCDGTDSTPDLRGRFVVGRDPTIGSPYTSIGNSGGANTASLAQGNIPAHQHSLAAVNVQVAFGGGHYHSWRGWRSNNTGSDNQVRSREWIAGDDLDTVTGVPVAPGHFTHADYGAHQHTATLNPAITGDGQPALPAGLGGPFNTMPPYYTIAYIMKD